MYVTLIHHPALAQGLRVLQSKNKSPKSLSASWSHAPYNKFLASPKVASNNFNKSLVMYLLYLRYVKVRLLFWLTLTCSFSLRDSSRTAQGVIYSDGDRERHSLDVQDQAVLLLVPGKGCCLPQPCSVRSAQGRGVTSTLGSSTALPEHAASTGCLQI